MHKPGTMFPRQSQLVLPLVEAVDALGGAPTAKDVSAHLAERYRLPREAVEHTTRSADGQDTNTWRRHVRFVKLRAQSLGHVISERGRWRATDEAREALTQVRPVVTVEIVRGRGGAVEGAIVRVEAALPTAHAVRVGDARDLAWIGDGDVDAVITSVPYFDLVPYPSVPGQMADVGSYEAFVDALGEACREFFRVLAPSGQMALNVGPVLRSRRRHGHHEILPLPSDLESVCRRIGFRVVNGVIWRKVQTVTYEQRGAGGVLGTPGMPRARVPLHHERILMFERPGPYRSVSPERREASRMTPEEHRHLFRDVWDDIPGARATKEHPCPWPIELPTRLVKMLSWVGDTILDPYFGRGTLALSAAILGRNSLGVEAVPEYVERGVEWIEREIGRRVSP